MQKKVERVAAQLGSMPERPVDQHPLVREKLAERERAALDLARTTIRAPLGGTAVNVKLQKGEQIKAATTLFALVSHTRPWVEANFKETELTHVRKGLGATVVLDIYPDVVWQAEVESISPATGAEFALLPPQNASGNWVKVVQRLPVRVRLLPQPGEPPLRAGMTATVRVDTGRERRLSNLFGGWTAWHRAKVTALGEVCGWQKKPLEAPASRRGLSARGLVAREAEPGIRIQVRKRAATLPPRILLLNVRLISLGNGESHPGRTRSPVAVRCVPRRLGCTPPPLRGTPPWSDPWRTGQPHPATRPGRRG